ncbi:electron transfer flavoprotein subunit beta [Alteromonas sp. 1_MG-2023]|uniref:electron transfer flavoprotein subunit beta n=1 Tax=Alteromonas sp. 1_MG-2023 TaxID=3062669 RepID=UPI0026E1B3B6|nr:electron transfer flavoprotein subunit beta [Alteromonas sp. 1_MG-2023]MDO6566516.1 electron transfer flavoprotein subunit beta [Alteromonas sp. 1_MG-2023]
MRKQTHSASTEINKNTEGLHNNVVKMVNTASKESVNVTVLVSVGEHPLSKRPRRAEQDARAIEIGLNLPGTQLHVMHAGAADNVQTNTVLKDYLGMGLPEIQVLNIPQEADNLTALTSNFTDSNPDIILTGIRAENGESSGMLPYVLSEQLGMALVPSITEILSVDKKAGFAELLQALPRGQRRKVRVKLPFVATVDMAAKAPRQSAFGAAMRGKITVVDAIATATTNNANTEWKITPAQPRPKRLKVVKAKTAADRFKAATAKAQGGAGKVIYNNQEAADAILKMLTDEKVL